jgi:hypothetical protein
MPRFVYPAAAILLVLTVAGGCEQGPAPLALVRGQVRHRGVPLHTGTVVFTPDALRGATGPLASGDIQPDGSYTLSTGGAPGAVPGWHRVTVLAVEVGKVSLLGQKPARPRSLLPEKYSDPELSNLAGEVKLGQENTINFDLE